MVLVLVGLAHGTIDESADRIQKVGADIIFQGPDSSPFFVLNTGVLSVRLREKLLEVDGIEAAAPVLTNRVTSLKGENKIVLIFGVDEDYDTIGRGIEIVEGRGLEDSYDLIIDTVLAQADDIAVGETLQVMGRDFNVAGICKAGAGVRIYMGLETMQMATAQPDKASFFFVRVTDGAELSSVASELETRFEGYQVTAMEGFADAIRENALGMKEFVRVLSMFAALISFLMVLVVMYTTVIERTREIGILKGLGATKIYIIKLVMAESFLICLLGVIVGFILSLMGRAVVLTLFPTLTVALLPGWFALAAALGIVGGLTGAVYPAYRAAKLDAVEALNFE